MKIAGLRAIQPKSFEPRTTESRHHLGHSAYLLLDLDEPTYPHRLWVGDITYIPITEIGFGFGVLHTVFNFAFVTRRVGLGGSV